MFSDTILSTLLWVSLCEQRLDQMDLKVLANLKLSVIL